MALIFDIEADGLLQTVTKVHCLVFQDTEIDTHGTFRYVGDDVERGVEILLGAQEISGHSVIKYDIPVLEKLYGVKFDQSKVFDTIVATRLIFSDCYETDCQWGRRKALDKALYGRHSLKAWGQRLGVHKGDYTGGFETFSQEMLDYCVQDVEVTARLYSFLKKKNYSQQALDLEHQVAWIIARQERFGFAFDTEAALDLAFGLLWEQDALREHMIESVGLLTHPGAEFTPKRDNKKLHYTAGGTLTKVTFEPFNPGSRQQIGKVLMSRGWMPTNFTETGQVEINESTLKDAPEPLGSDLKHYLLLDKRLGALIEGKNSWLNCVTTQGRIHGGVNPNGAVTGRATHSKPNLTQVPTNNKPYGKECRALFRVPEGKVLVGADLSGLELRCLAHFMHKYDNGEYGRLLLEGDPHSLTAEAIGLNPKEIYILNGVQDNGREFSKRWMYAFLYGAGEEKCGAVVGRSKAEGGKMKQQFLAKLPALAKLIRDLGLQVEQRGHLIGLDGRKLNSRSPHAALNLLLQSAGALLAKQAIIFFEEEITGQYRDDINQAMWAHDELQVETLPELAESVGKTAVRAFERAGKHFNFNIEITGKYKVGQTWQETH